MYHVYELRDPVTYELCYIGITDNPEKRRKQHIECFLPSSTYHFAVIFGGRIFDLQDVKMVCIECYPTKRLATKREKELITEMALDDIPLVNINHYLSIKRLTHDVLENRFSKTKWYPQELKRAYSQ